MKCRLNSAVILFLFSFLFYFLFFYVQPALYLKPLWGNFFNFSLSFLCSAHITALSFIMRLYPWLLKVYIKLFLIKALKYNFQFHFFCLLLFHSFIHLTVACVLKGKMKGASDDDTTTPICIRWLNTWCSGMQIRVSQSLLRLELYASQGMKGRKEMVYWLRLWHKT